MGNSLLATWNPASTWRFLVAMPRFFFDIYDDGQLVKDVDGAEMADIEAARREALGTLWFIAKGEELPDSDQRDFVITVHNEDEKPLLKATLSVKVERA